LRERVVGAFSRRPDLFDTMLATHVGAAPAMAMASGVVTLGLQLLVP
jgi:hypothetical protein